MATCLTADMEDVSISQSISQSVWQMLRCQCKNLPVTWFGGAGGGGMSNSTKDFFFLSWEAAQGKKNYALVKKKSERMRDRAPVSNEEFCHFAFEGDQLGRRRKFRQTEVVPEFISGENEKLVNSCTRDLGGTTMSKRRESSAEGSREG